MEIIIFCQAPADIPYLLTVYENNKERSKISVFVINVENMFKFLQELDLELEQLVFIPYLNHTLKKVSGILESRRNIRALINQHFSIFSNAEVYFFSRFEDWMTAAFVRVLSVKNNVTYLDHYDNSANVFNKQKLNIRSILIKTIYRFITGVDFKMEIVEKLPEFHYKKYDISRVEPIVNPIIFSKYSYALKHAKGKPTALFFISPSHELIYDNSHDHIQYSIFKILKKAGWNIIAKGHPRLGIPGNVLNLVDFEVPSYIPAEFISSKDIDMYLGIVTAAVAHFAKHTEIPAYSFINLFSFINEKLPLQYKQFLLEHSDNKIQFFKDFRDFEEAVTIKG